MFRLRKSSLAGKRQLRRGTTWGKGPECFCFQGKGRTDEGEGGGLFTSEKEGEHIYLINGSIPFFEGCRKEGKNPTVVKENRHSLLKKALHLMGGGNGSERKEDNGKGNSSAGDAFLKGGVKERSLYWLKGKNFFGATISI